MGRGLINRRQLPRRGHLFPQDPEIPWSHPVLAPVSRSCPRPKGRLPTRYSPVRRSTKSPKGSFALDLHVLGTSPTFVLSQDQTLQFEPQLPSELTSQITHYSVFKEQTNYPNTTTQIPASGNAPRVPFIKRQRRRKPHGSGDCKTDKPYSSRNCSGRIQEPSIKDD